MATVQLDKRHSIHGDCLLEPSTLMWGVEAAQLDPSLVQLGERIKVRVVITNPTGITQKLKKGIPVGQASEAAPSTTLV